MQKIISDCYQKSIELIINNSSQHGLLASSPQKKAKQREYLSIFARDASISSLGMVSSQNKKLLTIAKKSLLTLAHYQAHDGEIPNYVRPEISYVDFWRLGSIDASLWWLIAIDFYDRHSKDKQLKKRLKAKIIKCINWLYCQEHEDDGLLVQAEASDWADIMPRNGKVLYANVLWCRVQDIYNLPNKNKSKKNLNRIFFPFDKMSKPLPNSDRQTVKMMQKQKNPKDFLRSFISYKYYGHDVDVFANSLAIFFGVANKTFSRRIIGYFESQRKHADYPLPVLFKPIKKNSPLWRKYMESHGQNHPYQYHNGGIWPFAACFYAMALWHNGQKKLAKMELLRIAKANSLDDWGFSEWFQAKTKKALGMRGQSWNAGAFLLAYHYMNGDISIKT